jgi:hypothetical protein
MKQVKHVAIAEDKSDDPVFSSSAEINAEVGGSFQDTLRHFLANPGTSCGEAGDGGDAYTRQLRNISDSVLLHCDLPFLSERLAIYRQNSSLGIGTYHIQPKRRAADLLSQEISVKRILATPV